MELYFDCEWDAHQRLITFQYYDAQTQNFDYILFDNLNGIDKIKEVIRGRKLIGYNIVSDFTVLLRNGIQVFDLISDYEDLYLMALLVFYSDFTEKNRLALDEVLQKLNIPYTADKDKMQKFFLNFKPSVFKLSPEIVEYLRQDVIYLPKLHKFLITNLTKSSRWLYEKIEKPMVRVTALMNIQGFGLDLDKLCNKMKELREKRRAIEQEIRQMDSALRRINLNSPLQLQQYFNVSSTSRQVLVELAQHNEVAKKILEYKQLEKEFQFCKQLMSNSRDNKIFGNFFVTSAPSGRMACRDINLQQIPRNLRDVFISKYQNGYLVVVDFPQIEIRLTALFYSRVMRNLLKQNLDLHTETAKMLFPSKQEITKEDRQIAKSANFGLLYGMGWKAFKDYVFTNTGIKLEDIVAQQLRENWLNFYHDVRTWHSNVNEILTTQGYYEDRTILFRPYQTDNLNKALNYKIQGSGADLLKAVVVKFYEKTKAIPTALVHDELVYDVETYDEAYQLVSELADTIQYVWQLFFDIASKYHRVKTEYFPLELDKESAIIKVWADKQ